MNTPIKWCVEGSLWVGRIGITPVYKIEAHFYTDAVYFLPRRLFAIPPSRSEEALSRVETLRQAKDICDQDWMNQLLSATPLGWEWRKYNPMEEGNNDRDN